MRGSCEKFHDHTGMYVFSNTSARSAQAIYRAQQLRKPRQRRQDSLHGTLRLPCLTTQHPNGTSAIACGLTLDFVGQL